MARSSCGLVVLYACSECKRSTLVTQSQLQNWLLEQRRDIITVIQAGLVSCFSRIFSVVSSFPDLQSVVFYTHFCLLTQTMYGIACLSVESQSVIVLYFLLIPLRCFIFTHVLFYSPLRPH